MIIFQQKEARAETFREEMGSKRVFDGTTLVSICPGETPDVKCVSLAIHFPSNPIKEKALLKDIQEKIAFLHSKVISVGSENLNLEKILVVESTRGPCVILTTQEGSAFKPEDDICAAGELFRLIWSSGSRVPDLLESNLITKMTKENTTMTAFEALHHFAFWSSKKRLGFLKKVSDILELKQKRHGEAVEADKRFLELYW